MRNNIVYMYIVYILLVYLLWLMDITILIYYIFWISNVFLYPLLWLWIKIMYYNRTVLLLLIFYYFLAKFTIKELGYKYIYFFKKDIKNLRSVYINYIWNITTYHVEIISIFIFFGIIITPLFLHHKEISILVLISLIIPFLFLRIIKNKLNYIKNRKIKLKELFFICIFIYISIQIFNHQYFKDIIITYIHLDRWTFDLLEWKIQTYEKIMKKDLYTENIGLSPVWIGEKISKDDIKENKVWDFLYKKQKSNLVKDLKYKLKKTNKKYYLYTKYYEKTLKIKELQWLKKLEKLRKLSYYNMKFNNNVVKKEETNIKEFTPLVNTEKENPVITQEKERERELHQTILSNWIFKFSVDNYYELNSFLRDLTLHSVYYQMFIDPAEVKQEFLIEKKNEILINIKERITIQEDLKLYKKILNKIKESKKLHLDLQNNKKEDYYIIDKLYNNLFLKKGEDNSNIVKIFHKIFKIEDEEEKKKKKTEIFNINNLLKITKEDIKIKKKWNAYNWLKESKKNILNKDNLEEIEHTFSNFVEKEEVEKMDNQKLLNTVKKYNEEKKKGTLVDEFDYETSLVLKENKEDLTIVNGPDLSRRNKK